MLKKENILRESVRLPQGIAEMLWANAARAILRKYLSVLVAFEMHDIARRRLVGDVKNSVSEYRRAPA